MAAFALDDDDPQRARRLAMGYLAGVAICAATAGVAALFGGPAAIVQELEEVVNEVSLVTKPPAPEPPALEPASVEAPSPVAAPAAPARRPLPAAPTAMPTQAPSEAEPTDDPRPAAGGDEGLDGSGAPGGTGVGRAVAAAAPPPPPRPPPPPPARSGPVALPSDATPPQALSNASPPYPERARKESVEATIVVKFVVTETGDVIDATIVRGHPLFDAAVLAAVRSWRYRPAVHAGRPIRVYRVARIPFKLKT